MAILWKDVLWLGTWTTSDGRKLTVRRPDLNIALLNGKRMIANNLGVPWCWDHQADATPVEMSSTIYASPDRRAGMGRNIITPKTVDFQIRQTRKGPAVFAAFDTNGLTDWEVEQIKRAGNVSCRIDRGFWDARGQGAKYPGLSIGHIAVTPKPLEPNQGPFFMSALRCADESFYLGYGTMAKDTDDDDTVDNAAPAEETIDPSELEVPEEQPEVEVPPVEVPAGPDPLVTSILTSLNTLGLPLPDDGSLTDFSAVDMALKMAVKMKFKLPPETTDDNLNYTPNDSNTMAGSGPPMLMSQAAMQAKAPARVEIDRRNLQSQIKLLFKDGCIDGPTRDTMLKGFESFEMSYSAAGKLCVRGLIAAVREIRKYVKPGTFLKRKPFNMSQTTTVNLPNEFKGKSKKEQEEANAELLRKEIEAENAEFAQ